MRSPKILTLEDFDSPKILMLEDFEKSEEYVDCMDSLDGFDSVDDDVAYLMWRQVNVGTKMLVTMSWRW